MARARNLSAKLLNCLSPAETRYLAVLCGLYEEDSLRYQQKDLVKYIVDHPTGVREVTEDLLNTTSTALPEGVFRPTAKTYVMGLANYLSGFSDKPDDMGVEPDDEGVDRLDRQDSEEALEDLLSDQFEDEDEEDLDEEESVEVHAEDYDGPDSADGSDSGTTRSAGRDRATASDNFLSLLARSRRSGADAEASPAQSVFTVPQTEQGSKPAAKRQPANKPAGKDGALDAISGMHFAEQRRRLEELARQNAKYEELFVELYGVITALTIRVAELTSGAAIDTPPGEDGEPLYIASAARGKVNGVAKQLQRLVATEKDFAGMFPDSFAGIAHLTAIGSSDKSQPINPRTGEFAADET
jgi:hypothetical protein